MKIVIDAMGGDNAPQAIVSGALLALEKYDDLQIILTGKKETIQKFIPEKFALERLEIIDCDEVIENDETPTIAIKQKPNSSLVVGFDILKANKADAIISAGSTGAILTCGFLKIGRIKGVSRPALAPFLPTKDGSKVLLIDCGANMDCKSINLLHFAVMGSCYMQYLFDMERPRVALLNVGTEDKKGNELAKESYELLKNADINFIGNIEARDITSGVCDVVVCDGFNGNIALKATEGAVALAMNEVKNAFSGFWGKVGGLFVYKKLKKSKVKLDYNKYGGSPFLGVKKIVIKSHGSSKAETILACVKQAKSLYDKKVIAEIENLIKMEICDEN